MDFLTVRLRRVSGTSFSRLPDPPQGCVLSTLLFVLYTNECRGHYDGRRIIKLADDSVIVSLLSSNDSEHGPVVNHVISWCQ